MQNQNHERHSQDEKIIQSWIEKDNRKHKEWSTNRYKDKSKDEPH